MQLCVSVQIPVCFEGLQAEAIYVDTNSNFSEVRLTGRYLYSKHNILKCKNKTRYHDM